MLVAEPAELAVPVAAASPLEASMQHPVVEAVTSSYLLMALAFAAGVLCCLAVQTVVVRVREMQRRRATTNILKPLLHSIDS